MTKNNNNKSANYKYVESIVINHRDRVKAVMVRSVDTEFMEVWQCAESDEYVRMWWEIPADYVGPSRLGALMRLADAFEAFYDVLAYVHYTNHKLTLTIFKEPAEDK